MDLTPEQQESFLVSLKRFGMDPSKVHPIIGPPVHDGDIVLTGDAEKSTVPPQYLTAETVDEVKRLGGIPDEDYESGRMEEHHDIPPEWPQDKNNLDDLTPDETAQVNQAHTVYVYGYSKRVRSYREIIQRHFYPMTVACYAAEKLNVTSKTTISGCHVYGTVTIYKNGSLVMADNAAVDCQNMVKSDAVGPS